jgi:predicted nucleic acid-binding protein
MSVVLDASATLAWFYTDETSLAIRHIFDGLVFGGAWVPSIWRLEIANILEMGLHRGRHNIAFLESTLADLSRLPISLDPETDRHVWNATLQLARHHQLTVYDAAYLELAQRRGLPLASLDRDLRKAATAQGIPLLGI